MKPSKILAVTILLSHIALFAPAQAASGRGGWDGNGTSVTGLAQGGSAQAWGRGGWDANGTSVSGLAAATR